MACKPGSVPARRQGTTIPLEPASPQASRGQPEGQGGNAPAPTPCGAAPAPPIRPCSRWGLPCRPRCRGRGALLPHRFTLAARPQNPKALGRRGGLFSVALSLGSPPPVIDRHRISVEPGLSSGDTISRPARGRPAIWHRGGCAPGGGRGQCLGSVFRLGRGFFVARPRWEGRSSCSQTTGARRPRLTRRRGPLGCGPLNRRSRYSPSRVKWAF